MGLQVSRRSSEGSTQVASTLVRGVQEPPDVVDGSFIFRVSSVGRAGDCVDVV